MKKIYKNLLMSFLVFTLLMPLYISAAEKTLKIDKVLNLPENGLLAPNKTFNFTATKFSFNGDETSVGKDKMPDLKGVSVTYSPADLVDANTGVAGKQLAKTTGDMLENVTFTTTGQYTYIVKEDTTNTAVLPDIYKFSQAEYKVSLYVVKNTDGDYVVDKLFISKIKDDDGSTVNEGKVEYTPGTPNTGDSNFVFKNAYDKLVGNENPTGPNVTNEDKKGLVIDKVVVGDGALEKEFTFKVKVVKPVGTNATNTTYDINVVKDNGTNVSKITANYGDFKTFTLKSGERAVFSKLLVGSTATVEETETQGYIVSLNANTNDTTITDVDVVKNTGVVIGDTSNGNAITFTNTQQTPTGILLNNLPFIILILITFGGIYTYIKNRKNSNEF